MTECVIWDWNGTLLDDVDLCVEALNWLLAQFGYPQRYDRAQYQGIFGFPIEDYYRRAGFDFSKDSFADLAERYMQFYIPHSMACPLATDAPAVLAAVRDAGCRQVILSASPLTTLRRQAENLQVTSWFDQLLGLSDIYARSKVQLGRDWMARSGIDPARAVLVGDTLHDAEVARELGARCVLCAAGHQPRATLETAGVPVIDTLAGLPGLL